jgi:uncharacterized Ntn-hydrolase superfamily protein
MTFSILAIDKNKSEFGIAICSAVPCIGEYFTFGCGSLGVIAAQGSCNPYNGYKSLEMLKQGVHPEKIILTLQKEDIYFQKRQIAILNKNGEKECFTGDALGTGDRGQMIGDDFIICGNTLESVKCLDTMKNTYLSLNEKPLFTRLLQSLKSGSQSSADLRGMQSSALHVYSTKNDYPIIKMNIDDDEDPVETLINKTEKFMKSFYRLMPFFPQRNGTQNLPEKGSIAEKIFIEFKKNTKERDFNF